MGNGTQVIIGDGLADQASAHGENFDIDLSTLFNRVGEAEGDVKVIAEKLRVGIAGGSGVGRAGELARPGDEVLDLAARAADADPVESLKN